METFKVGDKVVCTDNDGDPWFVIGDTYAVIQYLDGTGVKDNGQLGQMTWRCPSQTYGFKPEAPSAPPEEDKALAWLKYAITSSDDSTDIFYRGYRAALEEMLEHGFGLSMTTERVVKFVPLS